MLGSAYSFTQQYSSTMGCSNNLQSTATCNIQNIKTMKICLNKKSLWDSFSQQLIKVKKDPISFKITGNVQMFEKFYPLFLMYYTSICMVIERVTPKTTKQFYKINQDHIISSVTKLVLKHKPCQQHPRHHSLEPASHRLSSGHRVQRTKQLVSTLQV